MRSFKDMERIGKTSFILGIIGVLLGVIIPLLGFVDMVNFKNQRAIRIELEDENSVTQERYNEILVKNDYTIIINIILITLAILSAIGFILPLTITGYSKLSLIIASVGIILLCVVIGLLAHNKMINGNKLTTNIESVFNDNNVLTYDEWVNITGQKNGLLSTISIITLIVIIIITLIFVFIALKHKKQTQETTPNLANQMAKENMTLVPKMDTQGENNNGDEFSSKYVLTNTPY